MGKNPYYVSFAKHAAKIIDTLEKRAPLPKSVDAREVLLGDGWTSFGIGVAGWWMAKSEATRVRYACIINHLYHYIVNGTDFEDGEADKYLLAVYDKYMDIKDEDKS